MQRGQIFPSGAFGARVAWGTFGADGLLGPAPVTTNCWPEAAFWGEGGRGSWHPRTRGVAPPPLVLCYHFVIRLQNPLTSPQPNNYANLKPIPGHLVKTRPSKKKCHGGCERVGKWGVQSLSMTSTKNQKEGVLATLHMALVVLATICMALGCVGHPMHGIGLCSALQSSLTPKETSAGVHSATCSASPKALLNGRCTAHAQHTNSPLGLKSMQWTLKSGRHAIENEGGGGVMDQNGQQGFLQ